MESPSTVETHPKSYCMIKDTLVETLAKTRLNAHETCVLFAVIRKTFGFVLKDGSRKTEDWISYSQIKELTEIMQDSHISRTIRGLVSRSILTKRGKKIGINKQIDSWLKLPIGVRRHDGKKLPIGVTQVTNRGNSKLPNGADTTETLTTENTTKDIRFDEKSSNHQEVGKIVDKSRKDIKYPKAIVDDIVNYYVQRKNIVPQGSEWLPIQQTVKTMLMNGRTPEDIKECIYWISTHWSSWDIRIVLVKMPEFLAGTLDKEKNKINFIVADPLFRKYQSVYHGSGDADIRAKMSILPVLNNKYPSWKYAEQWKEANKLLTGGSFVEISPPSVLTDIRATLAEKFSYGQDNTTQSN